MGDIVEACWEVVSKPRLNRETGQYEGFVSYKNDVEFTLLYRPEQQQMPQQQAQPKTQAPQTQPQTTAMQDEDDW